MEAGVQLEGIKAGGNSGREGLGMLPFLGDAARIGVTVGKPRHGRAAFSPWEGAAAGGSAPGLNSKDFGEFSSPRQQSWDHGEGGKAGAWGTAALPPPPRERSSKGSDPREHPREAEKSENQTGGGWQLLFPLRDSLPAGSIPIRWDFPRGWTQGMWRGGAGDMSQPVGGCGGRGPCLARGLQGEVGAQEFIPGVLNFPKLIPTEKPIPTSHFPRFWGGEEPLNPLGAGSPPSLASLSAEVSPCPGWDAEIPGKAEIPVVEGPQTLQGCFQPDNPVLNTKKRMERQHRNDLPGLVRHSGIPVFVPAGNMDPPMEDILFRINLGYLGYLGEYLGCCPLLWGNTA